MQQAIVTTVPPEEKEKKRIELSIQRKRATLSQWMEKVESLRIELELIQNEYDVRIGALLLKDNQLDLEIIQYKNLKKHIEEGMTYEEALKAEEDTFYNEILRMQKEQERIKKEEEFLQKRSETPSAIEGNIKVLWKNLIRKFHPDLTLDPGEKKKREALMKQINNAYATNNFEALKEFKNQADTESSDELSLLRLEQILIETENLILSWKRKFLELRASQWYGWKKEIQKKTKSQIDVFAPLERKLLDDIVKKIEILKKLKKEVTPQENL